MRSTIEIACCVRDENTLRRLRQAIGMRGAHPVEVSWSDIAYGRQVIDSCSVLIYDLAPHDRRTSRVIGQFRASVPGGPILLYVPQVPEAGPLLDQYAGRPGVLVRLQCGGDFESRRLQDDMGRLFDRMCGHQLEKMILNSVPGLSDRLNECVSVAIQMISSRNGSVGLSTATVAGQMEITLRTLQRAFDHRRFPKPKEFLTWITLLYVTAVACQSFQSPNKVAKRMGMHKTTIDRMRRRLLSPERLESWRKYSGPGPRRFELVFSAFLEACGLDDNIARNQASNELSRIDWGQEYNPLCTDSGIAISNPSCLRLAL